MTNSQTYPWNGDRTAITNRIREMRGHLEKRDLSEEERAEMDALSQAIDDLTERVGAVEAELGTMADKQSIADDAAVAVEEAQEAGNRAAPVMTSTRLVKPQSVRSFTMSENNDRNFAGWIRSMSPHATDAERRAGAQVGPIHGLEMRIDPALAIKTDVGGNHLISQAFNNSLITELKYACNWLTSGANIINTSTDGDVRVPKLADTDQEGAVIAEKVKDTEQPPTLSEITLKVATITSKMCAVSWEAMQDSAINLPQMLGQALGSRIGRALDRLISTGGDAAFAGFFKQTLPAGQKQAAAAAGKVTITDLIKLLGKLDRAYAGSLGSPATGLRWVMNSNTLTNLLAETASGSGEYLLADPEAGTGARILGIPVLVNNFADDTAAGKFPVYLADLGRNLFVRQHLGISLRRSSDFAFDQRSDVFVAIARYGSAIADSKAVVALEGK